MDGYIVTTLPATGRKQYRCRECRCHVNPLTHQPGSDDCSEARLERDASRRQ